MRRREVYISSLDRGGIEIGIDGPQERYRKAEKVLEEVFRQDMLLLQLTEEMTLDMRV